MFDEEKQIPVKITKNDVEDLFQKPKESAGAKTVKGILKWGGIIVLVMIFGFCLVNGSALYAKAKYFYYASLLNQPYPSSVSGISVSADQTPVGLENDHLIIPKIGINSPVKWNTNQSNLKESLSNGLVHLAGSSLPSDPTGNIFIVGDSSSYKWITNNFASVFALLNEISINDKIILTYQNKSYIYQVNSKATLKSEEIEITKPTETKELTLMTYEPIGTHLNKMIVVANQIDSNTTQNSDTIEADTKEKFTETQSGISPDPSPSIIPTPSTNPLPANTDLKFLPEIN